MWSGVLDQWRKKAGGLNGALGILGFDMACQEQGTGETYQNSVLDQGEKMVLEK